MALNLTPFDVALKAALDERAEKDELFAVSYAKPNKSLKECCKYVYQEVEKANKNKMKVAGFKDDEIIGLAVHYYDEDDIVVDGPKNTVVGGASSSEEPESPKSTEVPEEKKKTRKPRKPKAMVDPNIPEPLDIPIF